MVKAVLPSTTRKNWKGFLESTELASWAFLGVRTIDFVDLSYITPVALILTGDFGKELGFLKKDVRIFSLETQKIPYVREDWTIDSYDRHISSSTYQKLVQYLRQRLQHCDRICFICYGTPQVLEKLQNSFGRKIEILSPSSRIRKLFNNKLFQYRSLQKLGLPVPSTDFVFLEKETYSHLANKFGGKFIIHLPYSDSGSGTFICDCHKAFDKLKRLSSKTRVAVSSFLGGLSLNMHAVIVEYKDRLEVVPSQPSIQLVGIKGLVRRKTIWSGNDFASAHKLLGNNTVGRMIEEIDVIGKWMGSKGWRGIFGVDFVMDTSNEIFPVDINARFQGSTQVYVEGCIQSGMIPITLLHLLQFLKRPITSELIDEMKSQVFRCIPGALLVPHTLSSTKYKIQKNIQPGVYSLNNRGEMIFQGNGYSLSDCSDLGKKECVVTSGVPEINTIINVDCPIFEVQTWNGVIDESGKKLNSLGKAIIRLVYSLIYDHDVGAHLETG